MGIRKKIWYLIVVLLIAPVVVRADSESLIFVRHFFPEHPIGELLIGKDVVEIDDYSLPQLGRGGVEYILLHKALTLGGYSAPIRYVDRVNYERSLLYLDTGNAFSMSQTVWLRDAEVNDLYISDPIIRNGEHVKGVYCLPDREDVLSVESLEQLRQFRTAISVHWAVDWDALVEFKLPFDNVIEIERMYSMLFAGRIDYRFLPFPPTSDLSRKKGDITLYPVPNLKLVLPGSRHFVVSKSYPDAENIFRAIQKGVKILRERGEINRAFIEAGFVNPRVKSWKKLTSPE